MNNNWLIFLACVHLLFLFFTSYFSISVKLYNYINSFTLIIVWLCLSHYGGLFSEL